MRVSNLSKCLLTTKTNISAYVYRENRPFRGLGGTHQRANNEVKRGLTFFTLAEKRRLKRFFFCAFLNVIEKHSVFSFFIEMRRLKCMFSLFPSFEAPDLAPRLSSALKCDFRSRFSFHSGQEARRFRATARFWKVRVSRVPEGSWPENTTIAYEKRMQKSSPWDLGGPDWALRAKKRAPSGPGQRPFYRET